MKSNTTITIIIVIIVAVVAFYGGIKYQQSRRSVFMRQMDGQFMTRGNNRVGFRPVNGEVISMDEKSITVKMQDGSSKIILLTAKTEINKAEKAVKKDIKIGEQVAVFGSENSDGSITAQNIQLNPQFGRMRNPTQAN